MNRPLHKGRRTHRPPLVEMPLSEIVIGPGTGVRGLIMIDPGCWDVITKTAYEENWILLEIANEVPVRAFKKDYVPKQEASNG